MVKKKITIDVDVPDGHATVVERKKASKWRKKPKKRRKFKLKVPFVARKGYEGYKKRMLNIVTNFLDEEFGMIAQGMKDILSVKRKFRVMRWHLALLFAGLTALIFGIAQYLDCLCPQLGCGLSLVLVGLIAMIIAFVYKRYS